MKDGHGNVCTSNGSGDDKVIGLPRPFSVPGFVVQGLGVCGCKVLGF